jgi:hypothetical protein
MQQHQLFRGTVGQQPVDPFTNARPRLVVQHLHREITEIRIT